MDAAYPWRTRRIFASLFVIFLIVVVTMTDIVSGAAEAIIAPVEGVFDSFGLMQGVNAPLKRFVAVGGMTGLAVWALRPDFAFQGGEPRPWSMLVGPTVREGAQPTATPWWMPSLLAGVVFSFLI